MRLIGLIRLMRPMRPMRPIGLIGLIGLISACSSEQAPEPQVPEPEKQETAIAFTVNLSEEEVTRATRPLEDYTTSFVVWAFKNMTETAGTYSDLQTVMPGYHVDWTENTAATTTTNTHDWEYILLAFPDQTIKFWDFAAKAYRFFAVAEMNPEPGTWDTSTEPNAYKYTCNADATNAEDAPFYSRLWFSNGDEVAYPTRLYGKPVTLEFIKPFAEVVFKFTYSDPSATPKPMLEEPDFRPATIGERIATTGTVTITFPIQGTATQESWTSAVDDSKYLLAFTVAEQVYTVLPIASQGVYQLKVTVNGEDKTCTVPAQYMSWNPGYRYTYIFKVSDEGGVELESVNIGVKKWQEGKTADHIIYNW